MLQITEDLGCGHKEFGFDSLCEKNDKVIVEVIAVAIWMGSRGQKLASRRPTTKRL